MNPVPPRFGSQLRKVVEMKCQSFQGKGLVVMCGNNTNQPGSRRELVRGGFYLRLAFACLNSTNL
jgi:hypothetical protein